MQLTFYLIFFSLFLICIAYSIIAIFHALQFSFLCNRTKFITTVFAVTIILLSIISLSFLLTVNWQKI